jgi:type IV secretion system protein VirD4
LSDKYDITKHKNYKYLSDYDEKNKFDIERELNPIYRPKPDEEVEVVEIDLTEE